MVKIVVIDLLLRHKLLLSNRASAKWLRAKDCHLLELWWFWYVAVYLGSEP